MYYLRLFPSEADAETKTWLQWFICGGWGSVTESEGSQETVWIMSWGAPRVTPAG